MTCLYLPGGVFKEADKKISKEEINTLVSIFNKLTRLERKNKMPIRIFTEKIIVDGKKYRGLVAWEGFLPISELPQEYMDSDEPAFYSNPLFHLNSSRKTEKAFLLYCKDEKPLLKDKTISRK